MSDSKNAAAVVTEDGAVAGATPMKGGVLLSPLPLNGGRKKSRRGSKKIAKALKKLGGDELAKVAGAVEEMTGEEGQQDGARRRSRRSRGKKAGRRHSRRPHRYSRRVSRGFLY